MIHDRSGRKELSMNLFDVIREVRHLLEENGRVSKRLLRRQFDLDDDSLDEVVKNWLTSNR
jgi:hypothetical protein